MTRRTTAGLLAVVTALGFGAVGCAADPGAEPATPDKVAWDPSPGGAGAPAPVDTSDQAFLPPPRPRLTRTVTLSERTPAFAVQPASERGFGSGGQPMLAPSPSRRDLFAEDAARAPVTVRLRNFPRYYGGGSYARGGSHSAPAPHVSSPAAAPRTGGFVHSSGFAAAVPRGGSGRSGGGGRSGGAHAIR